MIKEFTMSDKQLEKLLKACQPVPLIALQCGMPPSPQERANTAWKELGEEMGFEYMTVRPVRGDQKRFTAKSDHNGRHKGDPCVYCGIAHDDVKPGPLSRWENLTEWRGNTMNPDPKKLPTILKGKAYSKLRFDTWVKAGGHCETCNRWVPLLDQDGAADIFVIAHLSHKVPRKRGGDVPENVKIECFACHIENGHLKWRSDKGHHDI